MSDKDLVFYLYLIEGYSFKNCINIAKNQSQYICLELSPKGVTIKYINKKSYAVHEIAIKSSKLLDYKYEFLDSDGKLLPYYHLFVESEILLNNMKNITKKESALCISYKKDQDYIILNPPKNSNNNIRYSSQSVNLINKEKMKISTTFKHICTIKMQTKDFADICNQVKNIKCESLEIVGYNNVIRFRGIHNYIKDNYEMIYFSSYNSMDQKEYLKQKNNIENEKSITNIKIPVELVKLMSKIHNISTVHSITKIYYDSKSIKIKFPIGNYGKYIIYISKKNEPK